MDTTTNLTNNYLIAMPQLNDPNFYHTATYICEHSNDGAMGMVINRPLDLSLTEVLEQMNICVQDESLAEVPVYSGGPVQEERGFVLHRPANKWESTVTITSELAITTSKDILMNIAEGKGPEQYLVALGYAGWGAGQLERELSENAWLCGPADLSIMFKEPTGKRWEKAAQLMGVDLNLLSGDAGHA
ncbi:MAG TPA: YqgE/AlgH family protein [Gammaproteobacteria bacterium]|nr:YqgE/AlgH family protein [Gammaproteobacteria bacterium]